MANLITVFRIISSLLLLLVPTFSFGFYFLYLFAGFTDMMDGAVARKRNTVSEFGSTLDTVADFVFLGVCFWKIHLNIEAQVAPEGEGKNEKINITFISGINVGINFYFYHENILDFMPKELP